MKKLSKDFVSSFIKNKGGILITDYKNNSSKIKIKCDKGHIWDTTFHNLKDQGQWCPHCARNAKFDINYVKKFICEKGGECLSDEYINSKSKLKFKCKNGHVWESRFDSIRQGKWCPRCSKRYKYYCIDDMAEVAIRRGGRCLSDKYSDCKTKLKWECANGHIWEASPVMIISGTWCPYCHSSIAEETCRYFFEKIFGKKFNKFTINGYGKRFVLDGYCDELGIAFEHNGSQHYKNIDYFKNNVKKQKLYDKIKIKLCNDYNIKLLIIKELFSKMKLSYLEKEILNQCAKLNIKVPKYHIDINNMNFAYKGSYLSYYKELANSRGGKLVSKSYINSYTKLTWMCEKGHIWEATTNAILKSWCSKCSNKKRLTINDAKEIAYKKNGKCLSSEFITTKNKLKWKCNVCKHEWLACLDSVKNRNTWCPNCFNLKRKNGNFNR